MSEEFGLLDFLDLEEEATTNVTPPDVGRKRKLTGELIADWFE